MHHNTLFRFLLFLNSCCICSCWISRQSFGKANRYQIQQHISRRWAIHENAKTQIKEIPCKLSYPDASMFYIYGRKCLLIPARNLKHRHINIISSSNRKATSDLFTTNHEEKLSPPPPPPIIMLGGMAQTIESLQHHFQEFSRERDLLVYEYLGQGLGHNEDGDKENFSNISMEIHSNDFHQISKTIFTNCKRFDVVGFSLGARIILATIAAYPLMIRKAHLTGISDKRDEFGKIILASWRDLLRPMINDGNDDLRPFAWSIVLATYSKDFISTMGMEKIHKWIDFICKTNTKSGLYALLTKCDRDPIEYAASIRLKSQTIGQIVIGSQDLIAPSIGAQNLNDAIGWKNPVKIYSEAGHAVLNESSAREWRNDVIDFLKN